MDPCGAGLLILLFMPGCTSELLTLGKQPVVPYQFEAPHLVAELLTAGAQNANPTLTRDLLEIYFTSDRGGGEDVWMAQRASRTDPFAPATRVEAASSSDRETSSAISEDGLSLWFASDRPGGLGDLDIWVLTRSDGAGPWSSPKNAMAMNSAARDLPRSPGQHDLAMPMASDRGNPLTYRTMMASRPTTTADFGSPAPIPELAEFNGNVDGCLTEDGLSLFFAAETVGDLFVASRASVTEPFAPAVAITDLNTTMAERDPWMSPDGTEFYFSSDRDGSTQIYVATVHPRSP